MSNVELSIGQIRSNIESWSLSNAANFNKNNNGIPDFYQQVYKHVASIPKGKITTYGRIAQALNNPKAVRAVGSALARNPHGPYKVPCHRVVSSKLHVGKFMNQDDDLINNWKTRMLQEEGISIVQKNGCDIVNGNKDYLNSILY